MNTFTVALSLSCFLVAAAFGVAGLLSGCSPVLLVASMACTGAGVAVGQMDDDGEDE